MPFAGLPAYFLERLGPTLSALLDAAAAEGAIRGDVGAEDLLYAVAQLCQPVPGRGSEYGRRIVGVLVDGLRRGGARGGSEGAASSDGAAGGATIALTWHHDGAKVAHMKPVP